jgi:hypothetical protein
MASSSSTIILGESIHFTNLDFIAIEDGKLVPSTGTLSNYNPIPDTPNRRPLSHRKWANRLQMKQATIATQLTAQQAWLHQESIQPHVAWTPTPTES